jgi:spore germination protein
LDLTKKGGYLISYMNPRNVKESKLSIRQSRDIAAQFLDEKGYKDMSAVSYDQYQNVADIVFARRQNDVVIYPEKISVRVALDNGEVTGMQAADYVFEHKNRQLPAAKLSAEEAKKALNPKFEISGQSLALIKNDMNEEVLCHEFVGRVNGADYRVYINADTGYQEKIDTLQRDEKEATEKT